MPRHREQASRRAALLGLDDLIDEARSQGRLDSGALDLLLMSTRYRSRALVMLKDFLKGKEPRPAELEDLLVVIFASLLSRDKMPAPVQLNTFVEIAGKRFGPHVKAIVNAWGRSVLRARDELDRERSEKASAWLPSLWRERWKKHPALVERAARMSFERPDPGVWAFGRNLSLAKKPLSEWQADGHFQAMDPGSWKLVTWIDTELGDAKTETFLDACAAPGGKFIALSLLRRSHGLKTSFASDAKFARLERLKENVAAWKTELPVELRSEVVVWGEDKTPASVDAKTWDLVLADLPCSGSGTLHTRPDLLDQNPFQRLEALKKTQASILESLRALKPRHLFVSICSVDPEEVDSVSKVLGAEPSFRSWDDGSANGTDVCEGLTAWHLRT